MERLPTSYIQYTVCEDITDADELVIECVKFLSEHHAKAYEHFLNEWSDEYAKPHGKAWMLDELFDTMNKIAPPYTTFGVHPHIQAHGFWLITGGVNK